MPFFIKTVWLLVIDTPMSHEISIHTSLEEAYESLDKHIQRSWKELWTTPPALPILLKDRLKHYFNTIKSESYRILDMDFGDVYRIERTMPTNRTEHIYF